MARRYRLPAVILITVAMAGCGADAPSGSDPTDPPSTAVGPDGATTTAPATPTSPAPSATAPTSLLPTSTQAAGDTRPVHTTEATMPDTAPPASGPVEDARADLAERTGIPAGDIELVSADEVTWPDGALGCPEPGRMYTQALVNGTRIVFRADGYEYEYHSGRGGDPFYCPPAQVQAPAAGTDPSI